VQLVLDAVPAHASVLDLYAGAGLFALPLARRGHQVVAVEANPVAVADGEASRRLNRIPAERCRFIAQPVGGVARRAAAVGVVVMDPPREGCEAAVLDDVFGRIRPTTAVYVSCNPDTLARDLTRVVRHGYDVRSLQPVDMFPHNRAHRDRRGDETFTLMLSWLVEHSPLSRLRDREAELLQLGLIRILVGALCIARLVPNLWVSLYMFPPEAGGAAPALVVRGVLGSRLDRTSDRGLPDAARGASAHRRDAWIRLSTDAASLVTDMASLVLTFLVLGGAGSTRSVMHG
jgi:SAM-dependent methyltransferase